MVIFVVHVVVVKNEINFNYYYDTMKNTIIYVIYVNFVAYFQVFEYINAPQPANFVQILLFGCA